MRDCPNTFHHLHCNSHSHKDDLPSGTEIVNRTDSRHFNLAHLKSKIKALMSSMTEYQYIDGNCFVALSEIDLQQNQCSFNCTHTKLAINSKKTPIIYQPSPAKTNQSKPSIQFGETTLEIMDHFLYIGRSSLFPCQPL